MQSKLSEGEFYMMNLKLSIGLTCLVLVSTAAQAETSFEVKAEVAEALVTILEGQEGCNAVSGCPKKESVGEAGPVLGGGIGLDIESAERIAYWLARDLACGAAKAAALASLPNCDEGCSEQVIRIERCDSSAQTIESGVAIYRETDPNWQLACQLEQPSRDCTTDSVLLALPAWALAEGKAKIKVTRYCTPSVPAAKCTDKTAAVSED